MKRGLFYMLYKHTKIILEGEPIIELDFKFDQVIAEGDDIHLRLDNEDIAGVVINKVVECFNREGDKFLEITYIVRRKDRIFESSGIEAY
jgi:hypothetical protein